MRDFFLTIILNNGLLNLSYLGADELFHEFKITIRTIHKKIVFLT